MSDTKDKKVEEATTFAPAATPDDLAAKLAELDEVIRESKERNERMAAKEKELDELKTKFTQIKPISETEKQTVIERHKSKAQRMKENLEKQDKVMVFVPLEGKEKPGTQLPVTLNGYRVNVPKGKYVKVPMQIGQIIMDSLNQTEEAVNNAFRVDLLPEEKKQQLAAS